MNWKAVALTVYLSTCGVFFMGSVMYISWLNRNTSCLLEQIQDDLGGILETFGEVDADPEN